jgi:hypothetical protein
MLFNTIDELEKAGLWQQAKNLLYKSFLENPNPAIVIRLCFICWYVLVEYGVIDIRESIDRDSFEECLKEVTAFALDRYNDNANVLFYLGYMISLSAWLWVDRNLKDKEFSDVVLNWERHATQMLAKSQELEPDDPIFRMAYLANIGKTGDAYIKACKLSRLIVQQRFSGTGEFDAYFRQVLTRNNRA